MFHAYVYTAHRRSYADSHILARPSRFTILLASFLLPVLILIILLLRTFHPLAPHAPLRSPHVSRALLSSEIGPSGRWRDVSAVLGLPPVVDSINPLPIALFSVEDIHIYAKRSVEPSVELWLAEDAGNGPTLTLEEVEEQFRAASHKGAHGKKKRRIVSIAKHGFDAIP